MITKDGDVKKHFVEPQEPGDPFQVSDAVQLVSLVAIVCGKSFWPPHTPSYHIANAVAM